MNKLEDWKNEDIQNEIASAEVSLAYDLEREAKGFVYLIKLGSFYKIGYAKDVEKRMSQMITIVLPIPFELVYKVSCFDPAVTEGLIHSTFLGYRECGEWFNLSDTLVLAAILLMNGYSQCERSNQYGFVNVRRKYTDWIFNLVPAYIQEYTDIANETNPIKRMQNAEMMQARIERQKHAFATS